MKMLENGGRPFSNSAVRKQYSAEKNSANDFSANRRGGQFIDRPNAASPPSFNGNQFKIASYEMKQFDFQYLTLFFL